MTDIIIPVPAVGCRQCARHLSAVLRDVPGVVVVCVDPTSGSVTVSGDASREALDSALRAAGYDAATHQQGRHPMSHIIELSHKIEAGMPQYPGTPAAEVGEYLTHEASRPRYDHLAEFSISRVAFIGMTGTYLDTPYHRYADGDDISKVPLERLVDLDAVIVDVPHDERAVSVDLGDVEGRAVLFRSGWDGRWGQDEYWEPGPYLGPDVVEKLIAGRAALVGVDFWNVDDTDDPARPVHTALLAADILIVEHLRGLGELPHDGTAFSAVPLSVAGAGSLPVRAWARLPR